MTNTMNVGTIEAPSLDAFDGKKVVVKIAPWDDITFKADLPHIMRELKFFKGELEMHSHNTGTGEFVRRMLTPDEIDSLYLNESGVVILDKTDSE